MSGPSEPVDTVKAALARAAAHRESFDAAMLRIEAGGSPNNGGRLAGFAESLKSEKSLREKLGRIADVEDSTAEALDKMYDLNRYTYTFPTERFAEGVFEKYGQLRAERFEPVPGTHRDSFDDPAFKAVNTTWRHQDTGQPVEVQFHTPESFSANRDNHPIFEAQQLRSGAGPRDGVDRFEYQEAGRHLQAQRNASVPIPDRHALHVAPEIPLRSSARPLGKTTPKALEQVREDANQARAEKLEPSIAREQAPLKDAVVVGEPTGPSPAAEPDQNPSPPTHLPEGAGEAGDPKQPPDPRRALDDRIAEGMAARERQSRQDTRSRPGPAKDADREIE